MDGNWQAGVPGQPGQYGSAQYPQAQQYAQQDSYSTGLYASGAYGGVPAQQAQPQYAGGYAPQPAAAYSAPPQTGGSYSSQFGGYSEPVSIAYPTLPSYPEPARYSEPPRAARSTPQAQNYSSSAFAPEEPGGPEGSARFKVIILPSEDGGDILDVICQVGLDGIKLLDSQRKTTLRIYPLEHVTRWTVKDPTILTFYVKTSVDSDERAIHLTSDERTTRSILDVLTCSCIQLCELRGIDAGDMSGKSATNKLAGTGAPAAAPVPASAEGVEFWTGAEHSGWLTKKGEHLSTWRKRWFILKGGHLFWFYNNNVNSASRPRGIIPLKTCTAVRSASVADAGKPYSLELESPEANAAGARFLVADSEGDKNAWVAAVQKALGGIKAASEPPPARTHEALAEQLKKGFESLSASSAPSGRTVEVSNYGGGGGGGGNSNSSRGRQQESHDSYYGQGSSPKGGYSNGGGYGGGGGGGAGYGGSYGGHQQQPQQQQQQQQQRWQEPPQQQQAANWQVHYTNDGKAYYFNPATNTTQWDPPVGFS